jgi:hypothetical protein
MRATRGVTLTELLGAVAIMGVLATALFPAMVNAMDAAHRAGCAANLARLGMALRLYAQDNDGYLPDCGACSPACGRVPCDGRHVASRLNAPGTCNWGRVRAVGNQANLWMLVRQGYAAPPVFICPATADRPSLNSPISSAVMGFVAMDPLTGKPTPTEDRFLKRVTAGHCSYSYQCQFVHPAADPTLTDPLNATTNFFVHPANLPILADRNPYTRTDLVRQPVVSPETWPEANSLNHGGAGQNVLYLDGEVEWHDSPRCGPLRDDGLRDNIYWPASAPDAKHPVLPTDPLAFPYDLSDSFVAP